MSKIIRIIINGLVKMITNCRCNCACFGCKSSCMNSHEEHSEN